MPTTTATVGSAVGLHARPATVIANAVAESGTAVTIAVDGGEPVDAGSALLIMTLGAEKGTTVTISADDQDTLDTIAKLVETDLDA